MNKPNPDKAQGDLIRNIRLILDQGPDLHGTERILSLLGCPAIEESFLAGLRIYSDFLPRAADHPFSPRQRYLHVLWDAFDRSLFSLSMPVAFPFRRMVAKRLFRRCGKNFISEGEVRFNFGQFLSVGDDVFFNRGSFIDTKGGVTIGDAVGIGEFVRIFTHVHSESIHSVRTYSPVTIMEYAKVFSGAMILPGVTIGRQAIVAGGAVVTTDVPDNSVVAGAPARVIRERRTEGRTGTDLDHVWLHGGAFQDE
jgi:acetyltransferase-like isoleucine patch superfamily enzyme